VLLQQTRQGPIREHPPAGLTRGTIVHLVFGVADPLDRRAAHRTRLAIPAVHRHLLAERRDSLGETVPRRFAQALDPGAQRVLRAASVRSKVPAGKSNAASPSRPGITAPGGFHRNRPAIMRWRITKYSSSKPNTTRLPSRVTRPNTRPASSSGRGSTDRSRNGLAMRSRSRRSPTTRDCSASRYRSEEHTSELQSP